MPTPNSTYVMSLASFHFVIALYLKNVIGIDIHLPNGFGDWDWYWQMIPTTDLMAHPFASVWYFHAQPPLYNLWMALLMRLFFPNHIEALQYSNIVMGSLSVGMSYAIAHSFTKNRKLSLIVSLFVALSPSLFLFEAYMLYDLFVAFLVTTSIFLLSVFSMSSSKWRFFYLVGFIIVLTTLVLARSLYHIGFLFIGIVVVSILAGRQWKQLLLIGFCISLLPLGWYAKNQAQFGFFGSSSWLGLGLWKISSVYYTESELRQLVEQGILDEYSAEVSIFTRPSGYVTYGFDKISDIEALSRDNLNNINIPDISKAYQANAIRLIAHNPVRYAVNVGISFFIFSTPASRFHQLESNRSKLGWYEVVYADFLLGHYPFRLLAYSGSILAFALPLSLLVYAFQLIQTNRFSIDQWRKMIHRDGPLFFTALTIVYTTLVSSFFEIGENSRFRLYIEIIMWAFFAAVCYRIYVGSRFRGMATREGK